MPWYAIHVPDSLRSQIDASAGGMPPAFAAFAQGLLDAIPQNLHVNAWQAFGGADVAMAFLAGGSCCCASRRPTGRSRSRAPSRWRASSPCTSCRGPGRPGWRRSPLAPGSRWSGAAVALAGSVMSDDETAVARRRSRPGRCRVRVGRMAKLPPGPRSPAALHTLAWWTRAIPFFERCAGTVRGALHDAAARDAAVRAAVGPRRDQGGLPGRARRAASRRGRAAARAGRGQELADPARRGRPSAPAPADAAGVLRPSRSARSRG